MSKYENQEYYGVIDKIDHITNKCEARIYSLVTNEVIYFISFDKNEFSEKDQKDLIENAIFEWKVGFTEKEEAYSNFLLKRRNPLLQKESVEKEKFINDILDYFKKQGME